jgi:predicted cobalt transporter CbtA
LILALAYNRKKIFASSTNIPTKKKLLIPLIYATIMTATSLVFPPNPDKITIPIDLIISFRVVSAFSVGVFWGLLGAIIGILWDKVKLHETSKITSSSV